MKNLERIAIRLTIFNKCTGFLGMERNLASREDYKVRNGKIV